MNTITPAAVRSILDIPENRQIANALAFMARWRAMIHRREYGSLTIHFEDGKETIWDERVSHKEA